MINVDIRDCCTGCTNKKQSLRKN